MRERIISIIQSPDFSVACIFSLKTINFYVDNQGVIQAINKVETKDKLIDETKVALNCLGEVNTVVVNWIPGHEGYRGNEIADRLAKLATKVPWIGCLPSLPVNNEFGRNACREKLSNRQVKIWSKLKKERILENFSQKFDQESPGLF